MITVNNQYIYTNSILLNKIVYFTAFNYTIPHASTSAIYHQQYFYNFITFNESLYKILTYNISFKVSIEYFKSCV
jgi:hypothetical protein